MTTVTCHYCGATFQRAPQAVRKINICSDRECQRKYFCDKMKTLRKHRKQTEGQHPKIAMTVAHDPSGCFETGVKLIGVVQSVRMGCLPTGLMLSCGNQTYRVEGREATDDKPGREMLVEVTR